jgi:Zn finger protein HypA/HybF involved in hydrogenase expression
MHELSIVRDVIAGAESIAAQCGGRTVTRLRVSIGPLSGIEPQTFRDQLRLLADETNLGSPELEINVPDDVTDPLATSVVLESVSVAED